MNVLAFDTCFDACSVAAGRALRSLSPAVASCHEPMATGHAERLVPMIAEVLRDASLLPSELDRIAITVGPGTFTGTRITVAAARALALATGAGVVAVTSLKLMAMNFAANTSGADVLAIATDARRGEVYFECFDPHTLASLAPAAAMSVADAGRCLDGRRAVAAGSGAEAIKDAARLRGVNFRSVAANLLPDALDLLFASMEMDLASELHPLYLRAPDAKPKTATAIARSET